MPNLSKPPLTDLAPLKAESCTRALASDAPPPSRRPLAALKLDASSRAQGHNRQVRSALATVNAQLKTRHALGQLRVAADRHSSASFKPHRISDAFRAALRWSGSAQRTMWTMLVVPGGVDVELRLHLGQA